MCKMSMEEQNAETLKILRLLKKVKVSLNKLVPYGWEYDASLANIENAYEMLERKEASTSLCGVQG